METGLTDNNRWRHVGAIDNVATVGTCSRSRTLNRRWRALAPMLAIAFAALVSSCGEKIDANKQAEDNRPRLFAAPVIVGAPGVSILGDPSESEDLLERAGTTAVAAEVKKEADLNRTLRCTSTISQDRNTNKLFVAVGVPLSGTTYEERKKEAENPETRERFYECIKMYRGEWPSELSPAGAKSAEIGESIGVGAAHASNGSGCLKKENGSCSVYGNGTCC